MSAALYITAKDRPDGFDIFVNGKALSAADSRLSAAARKLGVPELISFFSQDPEEASEFMEAPSAAQDLPEEQWFEASEGLATVQGLLAHFSQSPEDSAIVEDLREFEDVLLRLKEAGLKWHLSIDF